MKVEVKIDKDVKETTVIILANELDEDILELERNIASLKQDQIVGYVGYRVASINQEDIIRTYACSGNVYIVTKEQEFKTKETLGELEEKLDKQSFLRISRSDINNLKHVKNFDLSFTGTISVHLVNGDTVYVSRRKLKDVKNYLGM